MEENEYVPLFTPHIPKSTLESLSRTLNTRWIGQGPQVDLFEKKLSLRFCGGDPGIAVGSGTDALHLAYLLAGIKAGDEVIVPVFTCTATNIPLLYIGAKVVFADVDPVTMNVNISHIEKLITKKTKAIVTVDFGGCPANYEALQKLIKAQNHHIYLIEDAAHALGAEYKGKSIGKIADFTIFSFQAIKHITTGDGGYLSFKNPDFTNKAKKLRWFGIDRTNKSQGIWENDITDIGYKYQMNDISASMGLSALEEFEDTLNYRKLLFRRYYENLSKSINSDVKIIADLDNLQGHAAWLFAIHSKNRTRLQQELSSRNIESSQVHYRNDRYAIFGERRNDLFNMDRIEDSYLVLPLHTKMNTKTVDRISDLVAKYG